MDRKFKARAEQLSKSDKKRRHAFVLQRDAKLLKGRIFYLEEELPHK
jgi:hypothetical protein